MSHASTNPDRTVRIDLDADGAVDRVLLLHPHAPDPAPPPALTQAGAIARLALVAAVIAAPLLLAASGALHWAVSASSDLIGHAVEWAYAHARPLTPVVLLLPIVILALAAVPLFRDRHGAARHLTVPRDLRLAPGDADALHDHLTPAERDRALELARTLERLDPHDRAQLLADHLARLTATCRERARTAPGHGSVDL